MSKALCILLENSIDYHHNDGNIEHYLPMYILCPLLLSSVVVSSLLSQMPFRHIYYPIIYFIDQDNFRFSAISFPYMEGQSSRQ